MTHLSPAIEGNFAVPRPRDALPFTGERMTSAISGQIEYEHLHRYCLARDLCAGRDVLDVASGEGYGAALLAGVARSVIGVELDAGAVAHAAASYATADGRLRFERGDAMALPLPDASVDIVVSFETIEHVADVGRFLDEVRRVLRPGGLLIVSTPDRAVYSAAGETPNPYHVHEMTGPEFASVLEARFAHVAIAAQRPVLGSLLAMPGGAWRSYERRSADRAEASAGLARAPYLVAVASDAALPSLPSSVYFDGRPVHAVVEAAAQSETLRQLLATSEAAASEAAAAAERRAHDDAAALAAATQDAGDATARAAQATERAEQATSSAAALQQQLAERTDDAAAWRQRRDRAEQHAEELQRSLARSSEHVAHLTGLLGERAEAWQRVHDVLDAETREAARLRAALAASETERAALVGSASWRLSRPLRVARRALQRLLHGARLPQRALAARALRRRRASEIAALRATPLFDAAWYAARVPGLVEARHDPAAHFAWVGAAAGLMPNAWFDPGWYRARHPEVARSGENPLLHWLRDGVARQLDPNPFLAAQWYVERYPEAAADPLLHWIAEGGKRRLDPNPALDAEAFALEYPAMRDSGLDALLYWWRHGLADGLDPHPLFDAAWYARQHGLLAGVDPLAHWLETGRAQGLATAPGLAQPPDAPFAFPTEPSPLVSVVIPAYGHYADTYRCLQALHANSGAVPLEVIVADDCPAQRVVPLLASRIGGVRWVQNPENLGFLRSCNAAEALAVGTYVVFLNNDTIVQPGWLEPLVRLAEADPLIGMVGSKLLNADGTLQEAGGAILDNGWGEPYGAGDDPDKPEYGFVRAVDVVVGACMLVRRAAFDALGGFDPRYAPAFYEEFDLAFALRQAGYSVLYQPESRVVHLGSNSYGAEARDRQSAINHARFCAKWAALLPGQPAPDAPELLRRQRPAAVGHVLVIDDRVLAWDRQAGAKTTHQYIGLLRREGYRVTYGAAADGMPLQPYLREMQQAGIEVLLGEDAIRAWLGRMGRQLAFVWIARPDVAGPLLYAVRQATDAPVLYYTHDLHHLRERRRWENDGNPEALEESKRLMRVEQTIFAGVDQVMTPSAVEAAVIAADLPEANVPKDKVPRDKVHVIPAYVVQAGGSRPSPADSAPSVTEPDAVTFVGGFAHLPNVDAALWLVREIMPLVWADAPHVRTVIVGHAPPPELRALAGERVEVTGFVEDLAPVYARSICTLSPLRYGAGIKGKVVDSVEAGVPVVTTSVGNEGIALLDGQEALVADGAAALAAAVLRLVRDPARRTALAAAAQARIHRDFGTGAAQEALRAVLGRRCCRVCGTVTALPPAHTSNWREAVVCPACYALNRMEAVADLLVQSVAHADEPSVRHVLPRLRRLRIHEFGFVGAVAHELRALPGFSCSDYFPGVPVGQDARSGVRCEDMTALTYADASFDLIISQDVLEHVPDPRLALRECRRVLKPGGRMLLATPVKPDRPATIVRARLEPDGRLVHLLPPEFHGDPVREEGALVFSDFGVDLQAMIVEAGFCVTAYERAAAGEPNGYMVTFEATRPLSPAAAA